MGSHHRDQDPLGAVLRACFEGRDDYGIIERDYGYVEAHSMRTFFTGPEAWQPYVHDALALARGRVLDIGCGAGRHAIHLQTKGFEVTGIDVSPGAIEVARRRGLADARVLSIENLSRLEVNDYATVLLLWNNFGLLGSPLRAKVLLDLLDALTTPDAVILAASRDPYALVGDEHDELRRENRSRGRWSGQIRMRFRYRTLVGPWYDYLTVSEEEMGEVLAGTPWCMRRVLQGSGAEYVAVLEKRHRAESS